MSELQNANDAVSPSLSHTSAAALPRDGAAAFSWRSTFWAAGVLALATLAVYANSFSVPFLFDDIPCTVENPTIRHLGSIGHILLPPGRYAAVQRRPVVNLSLAVNYAISGDNAWSYHVLNWLAHTLAAWLLFGIVRRTLLLPATRDRFAGAAAPLAFAIALLWAVHPLLTDAVTYMIQRTEVLASLFYMATLYCTIRSASSATPIRWHVAAIAACALAMGSKETALSAPVIVLLYDRIFLSRSWREVFQERTPLYIGLALTWIVILAMLPYGVEKTSVFGDEKHAFIEYLMSQPRVITHYLALCFWPHPLVLDYGFLTDQKAVQIIPYVLFISVILALIAAAFRWSPRLGFLGVAFFAILAPSSSVIPLCQQYAAEKRMYLPLAIVVALVVLACYAAGQWLVRRGAFSGLALRRVGIATLGLATVALGTLTVRRNMDYRDDLTIWQDTVAKMPDNARAHGHLALALANRKRFDESIAECRKVLELAPNSAPAYDDLGTMYVHRGQYKEAIAAYKKALRNAPAYESAHNNFGNLLAGLGHANEAIVHYQKALKIKPEHDATYNNLGTVLATHGQLDDAIAMFRKAVQLNPEFVNARNNLACALANRGHLDEAAAEYRASLKTAPNNPRARDGLRRVLETQQHKPAPPADHKRG